MKGVCCGVSTDACYYCAMCDKSNDEVINTL